MRRIKVRFSLQRGENYMKWKVVDSDGSTSYYSPCDVQLIMRGCSLKNNRKLSQKIYDGTSTKNVCACILCDSIEIKTKNFIKESCFKLKYNPKLAPYWMFMGGDVDNEDVSYIFTIDYRLCIHLDPDGSKLGGYII